MDEAGGANGLKLLSALYRRPVVNVRYVAAECEISFPTANRLVSRFEELGSLREITGQKRSRLHRYSPYLALFNEPDGRDSTAEPGGAAR